MPSPTHPPRRILLVDDDDAVLAVLRRTLRQDAFVVLTARDALEGLAVLEREAVDLVISDHHMEKMDGAEFLGLVRKRYPDTMRILLTGQTDAQVAIRAINEGQIFRFLTKPWEIEKLLETLSLAFCHLDVERRKRRELELAQRASDRLIVQC